MDLDDVRTFLEVADAGGLSPAARRLGVSKSIASRRLARLEHALGVLRPPGDLPPRKVRVLTDILLEYFGASKSPAEA